MHLRSKIMLLHPHPHERKRLLCSNCLCKLVSSLFASVYDGVNQLRDGFKDRLQRFTCLLVENMFPKIQDRPQQPGTAV